jgi:hypothetical protein
MKASLLKIIFKKERVDDDLKEPISRRGPVSDTHTNCICKTPHMWAGGLR